MMPRHLRVRGSEALERRLPTVLMLGHEEVEVVAAEPLLAEPALKLVVREGVRVHGVHGGRR
jgi:hypothetical protein